MYETADDPERKMTIQEQMESIQKFCDEQGYHIVDVYSDGDESDQSPAD